VAKQNSNGQMYLLTRTERYIFCPLRNATDCVRLSTISGIASMHLPDVGKRTKTFIGTTGIYSKLRMKGLRKSEKLRISKLRRLLLCCTLTGFMVKEKLTTACRGYEPTTMSNSSGPASGANAISVPTPNANSAKAETKTKDKDKNKKRHRKEEKRSRKELKGMSQNAAHSLSDLADRPIRNPSRSRSPRYRSREKRIVDDRRARSRSRSRTPIRSLRSDYDATEREREREKDRRRWDYNSRRNQPVDRRRY